MASEFKAPERELEVLPEIFELRPWYHDFSRLGLKTVIGRGRIGVGTMIRRLLRAVASHLSASRLEKGQRLLSRSTLGIGLSSHLVNQRCKEEILLPFLHRCLGELGDRPLCLDLFCADGYYSCTIAASESGLRVTGIDWDPREIDRARAAARALGLSDLNFACADVWSFVRATERSYDLILCAGGLYHLSEPRRFLEELWRIAGGLVVLQSVVSLEFEDEDYFETPAPGWRHGSRYSHARLRAWLLDLGWQIVAEERNELTGNRRRCDRGSSYFICRAPQRQVRSPTTA